MKKKDPEIAPVYPVKDELFTPNDLIFRSERIILPDKLHI